MVRVCHEHKHSTSLIGGKPHIVPTSFDSLFCPCPDGRTADETPKQRISGMLTVPMAFVCRATTAAARSPLERFVQRFRTLSWPTVSGRIIYM